MSFKTITLLATALFFSTSTNAAIISMDWKNTGDDLITLDMVTGLEWLDLSTTRNRSYNDISAKFGVGQEFEGWRYAIKAEISDFFDAFGGDSNFYNGSSTQNNGLHHAIAPYWGDNLCLIDGCAPGDGRSYFYFLGGPFDTISTYTYGQIYDMTSNPTHDYNDYIIIQSSRGGKSTIRDLWSAALVRTSVTPVPVPAAVWLFGSGLIGLAGFARRKKV